MSSESIIKRGTAEIKDINNIEKIFLQGYASTIFTSNVCMDWYIIAKVDNQVTVTVAKGMPSKRLSPSRLVIKK